MKRRDFLKSRAAVSGGIFTGLQKAAAQRGGGPVPGPQPNILFILGLGLGIGVLTLLCSASRAAEAPANVAGTWTFSVSG